jgi:dephospho-CoA kinase
MKQIGITGGIGSGKTTVCKVFQALGVPVYYADDRAKYLMAHDHALKQALIKAFGESAFSPEGQLNRAYLASAVFPHPQKLQALNALVHPCVATDYANWATRQAEKKNPYVLKEAALLIESGSYRTLDALIVVTAPASERIARVLKRDPHRTQEEISHIMERQMTDTERLRYAQYPLENKYNSPILPQILTLDSLFRTS